MSKGNENQTKTFYKDAFFYTALIAITVTIIGTNQNKKNSDRSLALQIAQIQETVKSSNEKKRKDSIQLDMLRSKIVMDSLNNLLTIGKLEEQNRLRRQDLADQENRFHLESLRKEVQSSQEIKLIERAYNQNLKDMATTQKLYEQQVEIYQQMLAQRNIEVRYKAEALYIKELKMLRSLRKDIDSKFLPVIFAYKAALTKAISHTDSLYSKYYLKDLSLSQEKTLRNEMDKFFEFGIKNLDVTTQIQSKEGYLNDITHLINEEIFKVDQVYTTDLNFLKGLDFYELLKDKYLALIDLFEFTESFGENLKKYQFPTEKVNVLFDRKIMKNPNTAKRQFKTQLEEYSYQSILLEKVKDRFERIEKRCLEVKATTLKLENDIFKNSILGS